LLAACVALLLLMIGVFEISRTVLSGSFADIETDTGLPVIANITAQLYSAFKAIGMREKIDGYGKLLRLL